MGEKRAQHRRVIWLAQIFLIAIGSLASSLGTFRIYAQADEPWRPPILLSQNPPRESGAPSSFSHPTLVSDVWGGAHSLWASAYKGEGGASLFYSHWDGTAWSPPLDILYTPDQYFWMPKVAADAQGWLHVTWTDRHFGQVWYARAPIAEAGLVSAWSRPVGPADSRASGVSIAADAAGTVHLLFCTGGDVPGVYHVSSGDGLQWSGPVYVGKLSDSYVEFPDCRTGQAVDARGRLHAVWGQSWGAGAPIYYSRSDDGGLTWLRPFEIDRKDERYFGLRAPARPSILTVGPDEVHIAWFGPPDQRRWHRWSADGGNTWSTGDEISPLFRLYTEPPAMAADSSGTLHLVSMGGLTTEGYPSGAYYTYWRDGQWAQLAQVDRRTSPRTGQVGEFAALAVTGDRDLHLVWDDNGQTEIWTSHRVLGAPPVPPGPTPIPRADPTADNAPPAILSPTHTAVEATPTTGASAQSFSLAAPAASESSAGKVLLIGALPAVLLVGLVFLVHWTRGRN